MKRKNERIENDLISIGNAYYHINQALKSLQYAALEVENIGLEDVINDINNLKKILFNIDNKINLIKHNLKEREYEF